MCGSCSKLCLTHSFLLGKACKSPWGTPDCTHGRRRDAINAYKECEVWFLLNFILVIQVQPTTGRIAAHSGVLLLHFLALTVCWLDYPHLKHDSPKTTARKSLAKVS